MAIFYGGEVALPASTPTKMVDAEEVDRVVYLTPVPTFLGFSSADVTGRTVGISSLGSSSTPVPVTLPAGKELWGNHSSGTTSALFVTAIAR